MDEMHPLRRYREEKGLTEDGLAVLLGVASLSVKRWEAAAVLPQVTMREKIKAVTGIPFSEFVRYAEEIAA